MSIDTVLEALQKIEEETCVFVFDEERYLKIRNIAREALAELDKSAESDARELARKVYDNYGHNDNNAAELIESFVSARERKTSEETARKCADAANKAISAYLDAADMCDCGHLSVDQTGGFELLVERAIMEAAK